MLETTTWGARPFAGRSWCVQVGLTMAHKPSRVEGRGRIRGCMLRCCAGRRKRATATAGGGVDLPNMHATCQNRTSNWALVLGLHVGCCCCCCCCCCEALLPRGGCRRGSYVRLRSFGSAAVPRSHSSLLVDTTAAQEKGSRATKWSIICAWTPAWAPEQGRAAVGPARHIISRAPRCTWPGRGLGLLDPALALAKLQGHVGCRWVRARAAGVLAVSTCLKGTLVSSVIVAGKQPSLHSARLNPR